MRMVVRSLLVPLAVVATYLSAPPAAAASPPLPSSMAALGDSITRAYDVCCSYGDHPAQSWSTGSAWYDGINSHYERIRRLHPAISGGAHNNAVSGAKMAAAPAQAASAVTQGVGYVTILLGANDLCTSSASTMTSTETFRSQFESAMSALAQGLPRAHIFVSSIPNIYQLWQVLHTNSLARLVWSAAHICQSMLASTNTEAQRQEVVARETAFNQILADVCSRYTKCRWDGGATYHYSFSASRISSLDYFHPSLSGQAALADVSWAASWWAGN
jgi:lysophospholipase L1-like esterase